MGRCLALVLEECLSTLQGALSLTLEERVDLQRGLKVNQRKRLYISLMHKSTCNLLQVVYSLASMAASGLHLPWELPAQSHACCLRDRPL